MSTPRLTEIMEKAGGSYALGVSKGIKLGAEPWVMIGYNGAITTSEEEIWANSSAYVFPTAAAQWRIAGGNAAELGTVIKGNAEGANQVIKCDAGGSETILLDANVDFSAATAVAVGDCVLLDPKGDSPEFGYVTDITDAATGKLVIGEGFSEGGSCATARAYTIVDKSSGTGTGAQVLEIYYLTRTFVEKKILVCLNGATAVDFANSAGTALTDTYRLNDMRVVAVGSGGVPVAAIVLQLQASPNTVYGNIALGYNVARAAIHTVPKDKVLYIASANVSAATNNDSKIQTARIIIRITQEEYSVFRTSGIFYPIIEALVSNNCQGIEIPVPIAVREGVDIKGSAIGLTGFTGPAACVLRGWTEIK
jgi:hypothetical protein